MKCTQCHERPIRARGLCSSCYEKARRQGTFGKRTCKICGEIRPIAGRELCATCYQRENLAGRIDRYITRTDQITQEGSNLEELYKAGMTVKDISEKIGQPHTTVLHKLQLAGVKMRPAKIREENRIKINEYALDEINTESVAYWLGFLYADGAVSRYQLVVDLQIRDIEQIHKLLKFLESGAAIRYRQREYNKGLINSAIVVFNSAYLANRLLQLGIRAKRDSIDLISDELPPHLVSHFIRGYFDGDGWIGSKKVFGLAFWGQEKELAWIDSKITDATGAPTRTIRRKDGVCSMRYDGRNLSTTIASWMYSGASIYLQRKYDRFIEWQNI